MEKNKQEIIIRDARSSNRTFIDDLFIDEYARICGQNATLVYLCLCRHANGASKAFPSMELMAEKLGISTRSVVRAVSDLVKHNIIVKERNRHPETDKWMKNSYTLLDKSCWQKDEPCDTESRGKNKGFFGSHVTQSHSKGAIYSLSKDNSYIGSDQIQPSASSVEPAPTDSFKRTTANSEQGKVNTPTVVHSVNQSSPEKSSGEKSSGGVGLQENSLIEPNIEKNIDEGWSFWDAVDPLIGDRKNRPRSIAAYYMSVKAELLQPIMKKEAFNVELRKNLRPAKEIIDEVESLYVEDDFFGKLEDGVDLVAYVTLGAMDYVIDRWGRKYGWKGKGEAASWTLYTVLAVIRSGEWQSAPKKLL